MFIKYIELIGLILNLIGTLLLAFSTKVFTPSNIKGFTYKIMGKNMTITTIVKKRFITGLILLFFGFLMQIICLLTNPV